MQGTDWAVVVATLFGPILAVQAQKAVERVRNKGNRKIAVFEQLMATRMARISPDHVRALNMIDLVFYGRHIFGVLKRTKNEQSVLDAWKEYLDHLNTKVEEQGMPLWAARGDELFTNILFAIARDVDYTFDRVQLKKGAYSPVAHEDLEREQSALRRSTIELLSGKTSLKMDVVGFPINEEAANRHHETIRLVGDAVRDGVFKVEFKSDH